MPTRTFSVEFTHRVEYTHGLFSQKNGLLSEVIRGVGTPRRSKVMVVLDQGVALAFPRLTDEIIFYFKQYFSPGELVCEPLILPGGEKIKNSPALVEQLYSEIERNKLCRHSYLIAIGGGALLDVVGFAAATAHRGIRHIRIPTTTLSQADSGLGVKNGINAFGKKNFIGTFAPPFAVINDSDFLETSRHRNEGFIEAIKVALIRDEAFFTDIEKSAEALVKFDRPTVERVVLRSAELHFLHITESGDPFEWLSVRPLDFGHWAAHKIEQLSQFEVSHGAAVGMGLALDTLYSHRVGLLNRASCARVLQLIQQLGFAIYHPLMKKKDGGGNWVLLSGLEEFREHLGGQLTVTLLEEIGRGVEVQEMNVELIQRCVLELERRVTC